MFNRIAEYLLVYELKFPQKIFVERLGFSRKSARKYFSGGIADEGRGINQFISRLRKVSESSVSSSTKFISEFLVNDLEYRVGKNKNEAPFVECFKYGYCMSIYDECKTLNIDPTEFLETVPQCYYSMMFIEKIINSIGKFISLMIPVMTLLMIVIIVARYSFGIGLTGLQEFVMYIHALVFLGCAGYVHYKDEHVRVDIFYRGSSNAYKNNVNYWYCYHIIMYFFSAEKYYRSDC